MADKKEVENLGNNKTTLKKETIYHVVIFLLLVLCISFVLFLLNVSAKKFIYDFNINLNWFIRIFVLVFIILGSAKIFSHLISENKTNPISKFFRKLDYWLIFTFSLVATLLLLSFYLYNNYVPYPLPIEGFINPLEGKEVDNILSKNLANSLPYVVCDNSKSERDFIIGKTIYCRFTIDYVEDYSSHIYKIERTFFLKNKSHMNEASTMDRDQINKNNTQYWNIAVPITDDFDHVLIELYFKNESGSLIRTNNLWITPTRILTEDEYYEKRERSLLIFLTTISILIFSTIASIKNLRDMFIS